MGRQITYRYNPETDSYERIYPTLGRRLVSLGLYLLVGVAIGAVLFILSFFVLAPLPKPTCARKTRSSAASTTLFSGAWMRR